MQAWFERRLASRAHAVIRDHDLLSRTIEGLEQAGRVPAESLDQKGRLREALRFTDLVFALSSSGMEAGGPIILVLPRNSIAREYPWRELLEQQIGTTIAAGSGWVAMPGKEDTVRAYLQGWQAAESGLGRLDSDSAWTALRQRLDREGDLLRMQFRGEHFDVEDLKRLLKPFPQIFDVGEELGQFEDTLERVGPWLHAGLKELGLLSGVAWTMSIDDDGDIVDRVWIADRAEGPAWPYFTTLGSPQAALDHLGSIQVPGSSQVAWEGVDFPFLAGAFEAFLRAELGLLEELRGADALVRKETQLAMASVKLSVASLAPRVESWKLIAVPDEEQVGEARIPVLAPDVLDLALNSLPEEYSGIWDPLLLFMLSLEMKGDRTSDALRVRSIRLGEGERRPLQEYVPSFAQARAEMEEFLAGREPLLLRFVPAAEDRFRLENDGGWLFLLEMLGRRELSPRAFDSDALAALQPMWTAAVRVDGGVLWEAHSNFGWLDPLLLPRSAPDAPVAKRFFGPEGVGELDESEF